VPSGANYYGSGMFAHWLAADNPALLILAKSRSATIGSYTIVQDDDRLGTITWAADDGTNLESVAGAIECAIDGTPGANDVPGRLVFSTTADGAQAPTERMRIDSTGNVKINDGDLVVGTSGHGIDFSATAGPTNGSGISELLDDYEEGTWTGAFNSSSGSVGVNASYNTCSYTKIGDVVHIRGALVVGSVSSPSGWLTITGMPFATHAEDNEYAYRWAGTISPWSLTGTTTGLMSIGVGGATYFYIQDNPGVNAEADHMQVGSELRFACTYNVS
jgi:hypothetical protein